MWVKQCHVYHPPVTIFIGGMVAIPSPWLVYRIVIPTLLEIPWNYQRVGSM